eukprot:TRINITY_DN14101_c0_g1_i1.p1 TRINITY_DN14101_c0_g1~~TRINITY_DN14101_c0_g1_i1.p1  ORF type:complete len:428 (-),score=115.74 TRINITY_DN14101_c0_g1_i1:66-1310(-)
MKVPTLLIICLFFFSCALCLDEYSAKSEEYQQFPEILYQQMKKHYPQIQNQTEAVRFYKTLVQHAAIMEKENKQHGNEPGELIVPFNCTTFNRVGLPSPTNVHNVRYPFIDVVAAIGDSITAAFGAKSKSVLTMLTEYRGVSWSVGGDSNIAGGVLTIPNLIKMYNANVTGFSTGTGGHSSSGAHYNQAVSGAVASDMLSQAITLHSMMVKASNFRTSYKLLTLFIGGNDLCDACNNWDYYSSANYETRLREAVNYISANFPNTILNLVPVIDVSELFQLKSGLCTLLHAFECKCGTADAATRKQVSILQMAYVEAAGRIANDPKYTSDNFTVVLQPFMTKTFVPQLNGAPDMSFFAMDCFHLSEKGHQAATVPLWNNMNEKLGSKEAFWEGPKEKIHCPSPNDFIWTSRNSQK